MARSGHLRRGLSAGHGRQGRRHGTWEVPVSLPTGVGIREWTTLSGAEDHRDGGGVCLQLLCHRGTQRPWFHLRAPHPPSGSVTARNRGAGCGQPARPVLRGVRAQGDQAGSPTGTGPKGPATAIGAMATAAKARIYLPKISRRHFLRSSRGESWRDQESRSRRLRGNRSAGSRSELVGRIAPEKCGVDVKRKLGSVCRRGTRSPTPPQSCGPQD